MSEIAICHIYGQDGPHDSVEIVGNREGLKYLHTAISMALNMPDGLGTAQVSTADGEGYDVGVLCVEDDWQDRDGLWWAIAAPYLLETAESVVPYIDVGTRHPHEPGLSDRPPRMRWHRRTTTEGEVPRPGRGSLT